MSALHLLPYHLKVLSENVGLKWASQKLFPWKSLPSQLASSTLVLMNWPADVIFPGEERCGKGSRKGISDLTRPECTKLVAALMDTSDNRIYIWQVSNMKGKFS